MKKMNIIYEDKEILVINKPSGILTIGTEKERFRTLYHEASEYIKKQNPKNRIFIVHRLDKDTSGIVMFAKNEKIKHLYQDNWDKLVKVREYYAIVEGQVKNETGTIKNYLKENKAFFVYSCDEKDGKLAITNYKKIRSNNQYTLLEVLLNTGRKNQIRVHMNDLGNPIIGDKKYGSKKNPLRRLGLHASRLVVVNPTTKKEMEFIAKLPSNFNSII